jgi:hypothetical protein
MVALLPRPYPGSCLASDPVQSMKGEEADTTAPGMSPAGEANLLRLVEELSLTLLGRWGG